MSDKQLVNIKKTKLTEQATDILFDLIVGGEVATGKFLPSEYELCNKIGISRSTLRESIKSLETKGLVKRIHGKGVEIVNESQRATADMFQLFIKREGITEKEILEIRNILEVKAAALAAERATPEDLIMICAPLDIMKSANASFQEYSKADLEFHLAIARATHNSIFLLLLESLRSLLHSIIIETINSEQMPERILHFHEKIYNAIKEHDEINASAAMKEHLKGTEEMIAEKYQINNYKEQIKA